MWGKDSHKAQLPSGTTLIACGARIQGDLSFNGELEIEGNVTGQILASEGTRSSVRVLESGVVIGTIDAPVVIINGRVEGDIFAREHLELAEKAQVSGTVHYQVLEVCKGAQISGELLRLQGAGVSQDKVD